MKGFTFSSVSWVARISSSKGYIRPPAFYYGELVLPSTMYTPLDTYVDLTGWGKVRICMMDFLGWKTGIENFMGTEDTH